MANMSLKKNPMPSQDPNVRNKNFDEVALGYTEEQALDEAKLRDVINATGYEVKGVSSAPYEKKGFFSFLRKSNTKIESCVRKKNEL